MLIFIFYAVGCQNKNNTPVTGESTETDEPTNISENINTSTTPTEEIPDNNWKFDTPENHGVNAALLNKLHKEIETTDILSCVIVKEGYIIDEYYKDGYDENSLFRMHSCTKSVTSALIGIAIDKGLLSGVEAQLTDFFPQLATSDNPYRQEMTILHLLEHTSGIEWPEWNGPIFRPFVTSQNWVEFIFAQPMAAKPGSTFNYTTGGSHLLSALLQQATGETAYDFALKHVIKPVGMDSVQWSADPQGITDGGNGIYMSARDAAKFGQLYLNNGRWGEKQIIPEEWVRESTKPQSAGYTRYGKYGYQWWVKAFGENGAYNAYYALGHGGQYIFVVPELKLVTVITSLSSANVYTPQPYFNDYVIAACG